MKTRPTTGNEVGLGAMPAGRLGRMLMTSDGTTTSLLESYLDEPVRVEVLPQRDAEASELAGWPGPRPDGGLLARYARLIGSRTGRVVLHARSLIALERLPERVRAEIREGRQLLGRSLRAHRVEQHREILATGHGRLPWPTYGDELTATPWRTFVIVVGGAPAAVVTEGFHLDEVLGDRG